MTLAQLVSRAYLLATNKATPPAAGTPKLARLIGIANIMQHQWAAEPNVEWDSLYDYVNTGTVANRTNYPLDDSIDHLSRKEGDFVVIRNAAGQSYEYSVVSPADFRNRQYSHNVVTIRRRELIFPTAFLSTQPQFAGTITVPAYLRVEDIANPSDEIIVDDPEWLAAMVAAEYVRNDITKQNQFGNLIAYAENLMNNMKQNNGGQITEIDMFETSMGETW